jgi:tetratricopeptide (TPR) repeat protein
MARMTLFQMMARSYGMPGSNRETLREQANAMAGIDAVMGHMANGTLFQLVEKDTAKAGTHFELGHALGPDNRAAALSYADYLWDTGSRDEALAVLDSFVENAPRDKPAHFNLAARLILSGGDYDGAKDTLERCLVLKSDTGMPSESMVRWCLGLVYHLLGEDARAQAEWSRAYDLDSDFNKVLEAVPMMTELKSLLDNQKGAAR